MWTNESPVHKIKYNNLLRLLYHNYYLDKIALCDYNIFLYEYIKDGEMYMKQTEKSEVKDSVFVLYRNIKYLREENGLSVKQMASIVNIREKHLALSEKCMTFGYFNDEHIKKLCIFFKVTPNTLFRKKLWKKQIKTEPK